MRRPVVVLVCLIVYGMSSMLIMLGDRSPLLVGGPSVNFYTKRSKLNLDSDPTIEAEIQKKRNEEHRRKCFQWIEDINRVNLTTAQTINSGEDPSLPSVTLSFSVTESEWWRIPTQIPHLIHSSQYQFTQIVVYIDNTPSSDSCASPAPGNALNTHNNNSGLKQELPRELHISKSIGWINDVRWIETDPSKYVPILAQVFKSDCPAIDLRMPKQGVVSFVQPLEDCKTTYCAHLNLGKAFSVDPFLQLLSSIAIDFALFKRPGVDYSWIAEGIKVLQNPSVVMVSPAGGPQLEGVSFFHSHTLLSSR